jgi:hypothetical protein
VRAFDGLFNGILDRGGGHASDFDEFIDGVFHGGTLGATGLRLKV